MEEPPTQHPSTTIPLEAPATETDPPGTEPAPGVAPDPTSTDPAPSPTSSEAEPLASSIFRDPGEDAGRTGAFFAALTAALSGGIIYLRRRNREAEELA
ncbi:hypothetical protein [Arsenicicoccus dermatophilus]|uniref:hypothetical protein n=1 Tax=Arsenicicoccus dermatophilus TaxID=1076331 RepID=UPI0039175E2D